jgi:tetratricopeptide (TPR) repeat protein
MTDVSAELAHLEAAIADKGASAADLDRLAVLKLSSGDAGGAVRAYQELLATGAQPNAALYNNLGAALLRAGRLDEAIEVLRSALVLEPTYLRARANLGRALCEAGRIDESLALLRAAVAERGDYVPALINLGAAHAAAGELSPALAALEAALRLEPGQIEARNTLGLVRLWSGQVASAVTMLRETTALAPEHADAHANLAHALFASGAWAEAWPHFEYRFRRTAHRTPPRHPAHAQRWDGTIRPDQELWLVGEQGLGDQLQFARYAPVLAAAGQRCVIACEPCLVNLLAQSGLHADVVAFDTQPKPQTVRWVPLLSVANWHKTTPVSVPGADGYLKAEPGRIVRWKERLAPVGLRVALAWAGNPRMETGPYAGRSPPLTQLEPLLTVPGVEFVSLQKGAGEAQLDSVPFAAAIRRFTDLDAGEDALLDTAAILKCVDLLVTSDTVIAHLGGALGVPTWLCLMSEPDWRWMREGTTTPWYRSMRLFRQLTRGDWRSVYGQVADELRGRQTSCRSEASPH